MAQKLKQWKRFPACNLLYGLLIVIVLPTNSLFAQDLSPVGRWKTINDKTGEVTSIVTITQENKM